MAEKAESQPKNQCVPESHFRFRTTSVEHLTELQEHIDRLYREGKMCEDKTFRSYVGDKRFANPESFPDAQFLIIMAVFTPLALVAFHNNGQRLEFMVPPAYYDIGFSQEQLQNTVARRIIGDPGHRIEKANRQLLLKTLAVRSGLGRYGRNNLCYVDGMGSLLTLHAYFTDYTLGHDDWTDMRMMEKCKKCTVCMKECPNGCITEDNFVINISRCVPLYNEVEGEFPKWMPASAHNALMGCMRCQLKCPAKRHAINRTVRLEDVTEEETKAILEGTVDEKTLQTLSRKLRGFSPTRMLEDLPVFTRNLNVLIRQQT
jgi:epoxyqueuosine reductase